MSTLDSRQREVLRSVVRAHMATGEPVASKTISMGGALAISAATIRSIMSDLEDRGLLAQPHTSAGRVPTDAGYRVYVDSLMKRPKMARGDALAIDRALFRARRDVPELLEEASKLLSRFSHHVGVVIAPEIGRLVVNHIEFVRLESRRVLAILVDGSGLVHHRILEASVPLEQTELDRVGRYLSEHFSGFTLPDMRRTILERIGEEQEACGELLFELGRQTAEIRAGTGVFIEGASNLVGTPDFSDLDKLRQLFQTLEEKNRLVQLLTRMLDDEGVQVVIGHENPVSDLSECSVVASPYRAGDRVIGTVGIVGPTRMEYARAIALVGHLAEAISRMLSSSDH